MQEKLENFRFILQNTSGNFDWRMEPWKNFRSPIFHWLDLRIKKKIKFLICYLPEFFSLGYFVMQFLCFLTRNQQWLEDFWMP